MNKGTGDRAIPFYYWHNQNDFIHILYTVYNIKLTVILLKRNIKIVSTVYI